jgi:hypothetical protein
VDIPAGKAIAGYNQTTAAETMPNRKPLALSERWFKSAPYKTYRTAMQRPGSSTASAQEDLPSAELNPLTRSVVAALCPCLCRPVALSPHSLQG